MKIVAVMLTMIMLFALPMETYAAKTVTASVKRKKSKAVKTGKQTIKITKAKGQTWFYVKFTAEKTKIYKFTLKNLRSTGSGKEVIYSEVMLRGNDGYVLGLEKKGEMYGDCFLTTKYALTLDEIPEIFSVFNYVEEQNKVFDMKMSGEEEGEHEYSDEEIEAYKKTWQKNDGYAGYGSTFTMPVKLKKGETVYLCWMLTKYTEKVLSKYYYDLTIK